MPDPPSLPRPCLHMQTLGIVFLLRKTNNIFANWQEPRKIVLGEKEVYKRKRGVLQPCNSTDDAYYISILDSLESLLNDEFVFDQVGWETCLLEFLQNQLG